jgi:hypothetical protein
MKRTIKVKNLRTGAIQHLTPLSWSFQKGRGNYEILGEEGETTEPVKKKEDVKPVAEDKDTLIEEYKNLTGGAPDGRWSAERIAEEIKELKDNK